MEITYRTEAAQAAIREVKNANPNITLIAGTVVSRSQAESAFNAGASAIVSPGLCEDVVDYCKEKNIAVFPGVCTPTEIIRAMELGIHHLKFFPAESAGGIKMLKSLAGPFSNIRFMPTGGINDKNIKDYLSLDNVFACGGSWMIPSNISENQNIEVITDLCREAKMIAAEV